MLSCQGHLFDLPENIHYLNGAYVSPQLSSVEQLGLEMLRKKSRPYYPEEDFQTLIDAFKTASLSCGLIPAHL